ncbi:MAG: tRNA (adenosine(37)-N6)-threonylcarbamoyltransferase complex dimerization subunit type 1 TsaB [Planctomycetaceae bacterium]|nr:tRNA (adenosine(37)-N6)-threonylcarbamoyltransferase complex dimerization subunit type 1 TsaB [Planctomycetaceae bacterium]
MIVLGIETSGRTGSAALWRDGNILCLPDQPVEPGQRPARRLAVDVKQLLAQAEIRPQAIDAVAVSAGPGSFTGLRVGYAFAKMFAYASGSRFLAIPTFQVIAEQVRTASAADSSECWVIEDAQRDELFVQSWQRTETGCKAVGNVEIVDAEEWLGARSQTDVLVGTCLGGTLAELHHATAISDPSIARPHAATVAKLAAERAIAGDYDDAWTALPQYGRLSAAEEKRQRQLAEG